MSQKLTAAQRQELKDAFNAFDRDGSGKISPKELESIFKSLNVRVTDEELRVLIKKMDTNGSGQIEFEEFVAIMSEKFFRKYSEEEIRLAFRQIDQDNSGYIQAKELESVLQRMGRRLTKDEINAMIKELDTTGDGKISFEEFLQLF